MKYGLVMLIFSGVLLFGCSQSSTITNVPIIETKPPLVAIEPTMAKIVLTLTPMPTATVIPTATEIVPGAVLFEEDFENFNVQKFAYVSGGWRVSINDDGNKVFAIKTNTESAIKNDFGESITFGLKSWENYSAEYRVKMLSPKANVFMKFRSTMGDNKAYYVEWMSAEYDTMSLHIKHDLEQWEPLQFLDNVFWDERWYRVRIEAQGSRLRVYLNDNLMLQADDARITHGGLEIGVTTGTDALFDDIRVIALGKSP